MKDTDLVRYSRHIMLPEIDIEGQKKISSSKISIVGLGGLGCSASSFLAASGVGTLNLIDDDFIDISNLPEWRHLRAELFGLTTDKYLILLWYLLPVLFFSLTNILLKNKIEKINKFFIILSLCFFFILY